MHLVGPSLAITSGCFCLPFAVLLETLNYEITQDSSFSLAFLDHLCPGPSYSGQLLVHGMWLMRVCTSFTPWSPILLWFLSRYCMEWCNCKRRQMIQFKTKLSPKGWAEGCILCLFMHDQLRLGKLAQPFASATNPCSWPQKQRKPVNISEFRS